MPQRVSPRAVRQLKPTTLETEVVSTSNPARTSKEKSLKAIERRSPRSPVFEKKRPSRISELEVQISQLQEKLKKANDILDHDFDRMVERTKLRPIASGAVTPLQGLGFFFCISIAFESRNSPSQLLFIFASNSSRLYHIRLCFHSSGQSNNGI